VYMRVVRAHHKELFARAGKKVSHGYLNVCNIVCTIKLY
jgi:hypothetical protein